MSEFKKNFGKRLKELRKSQNLTQEQLAEKIGIEPPNISKLENGTHFPMPENLEKLSKALNVEIKELFDFEHIQDRKILIKHITDYLINTKTRNVEMVYKFIKDLKIYEKNNYSSQEE